MRRFIRENLLEIRDWLEAQLKDQPAANVVSFEVPDPDLGGQRYGGERIQLGAGWAIHRGYKTWVDLAELLGCRLLTPTRVEQEGDPSFVRLRYAPVDVADSFHDEGIEPVSEKYGMSSRFAQIDKLEEPHFMLAMEAALKRVSLTAGSRVLDLGINRGEEFELLRRVYGSALFSQFQLTGIDHCASAIAHARSVLAQPGCELICHDINELQTLGLPRFDLLLSVGTLHSPGIKEKKKLLMDLVQQYLAPGASVILGFPNCRWKGGEVVYGAWTRNHNHPELSLLWADVDFARRYLQQHRFRVTLTGKYYVVLTATALGPR